MPADGVYAQFYSQAINKDAPHPAAARLWMEYLYSAEGQNLWLKGYALSRAAARHDRGRHRRQDLRRQAARGRGHPGLPSSDELDKANATLAENWDKAVS